MSTDTETRTTELPTRPCSVVWCDGHPYVLEGAGGRTLWMGIDGHGRPHALSNSDLRRRGWSRTRVG